MFVDAYGADESLRASLPSVMADRAQAMANFLRAAHHSGRQPWGDMFLAGHGEHWDETVDFIRRHQDDWHQALGLNHR